MCQMLLFYMKWQAWKSRACKAISSAQLPYIAVLIIGIIHHWVFLSWAANHSFVYKIRKSVLQLSNVNHLSDYFVNPHSRKYITIKK
jgi:hypothetical protein